MTTRYWVTNISPASGEYLGHRFSADSNWLITQQTFTKLPIPVLREWNNTEVVGHCVEYRIETDGSLSGLVELREPLQPGERLGTRFESAPAQKAWQDYAEGDRLVWGIVALSVTATPDPCGDVQTYTAIPD